MKITNILLKVVTITLIISSYSIAQSKINVNHLLDYGGLKFMPNSDKPFNGKVFELYDNGRKHWEKRYIKGIAVGYYKSWYKKCIMATGIKNEIGSNTPMGRWPGELLLSVRDVRAYGHHDRHDRAPRRYFR